MQKRTIFLQQEDELLRRIMTVAFELEGYEVHHFGGPEELAVTSDRGRFIIAEPATPRSFFQEVEARLGERDQLILIGEGAVPGWALGRCYWHMTPIRVDRLVHLVGELDGDAGFRARSPPVEKSDWPGSLRFF
jgi:hypothetical protein